MPVWQVFKVSRKTFFNPSAWLNFNEIKEGNRAIYESVNGLFRTPVAKRTETFAQAVERLKLGEATIERTKEAYFNYAVVFLSLAIVVGLFSIFLLFYHFTISGFLIGIAAAALFAAQAFKYHFWYFQIKHRKLGCTLAEWRQGKPFPQENKS